MRLPNLTACLLVIVIPFCGTVFGDEPQRDHAVYVQKEDYPAAQRACCL